MMAFLNTLLIIFLFLFRTGSLSVTDSITSLNSALSDDITLVSKGGNFELGFFSPSASQNRYLGIWYKNIPVRTVVWVANGCSPINGSSGLLAINDTGHLTLLDQHKNVVWTTMSLIKQARKPMVELLDSGNLVVREVEDTNPENYLWQSFDYPSDALLPGMKLGWDLRTGLNRRISSWKTWDDPCPANFSWGVEFYKNHDVFPDTNLRKGSVIYSRSGPWIGVKYSGAPALKPNPIYNFTFINNDDEVYYTFDLKNKSVVSRIVVNETTSTWERKMWSEREQRWVTYFTNPSDRCDFYDVCGVNGNCVISSSPICQCLKGFRPKSQQQWDSADWSQGCVRKVPLSCMNKHKDGFFKLSGLKLPDTKRSWVKKDMNLKDCRATCLNNCSCMAYSNTDIREQGSGCAIWFDNLMDIRQIAGGGGLDLYIRMPESELGRDDRKVKIVVIVVIGGMSVMIFLGYYFYRRDVKDKTYINKRITDRNGSQEEELELPLFDLSTINVATDYFSASNKLGEGGFGPVYLGKLDDGQEIAVKRLSMSSGQGLNELKNEVKLIAQLQHRNLVKLLGCCVQGDDNMLVYEYMPNTSLDFFIFDKKQGKLLEWSKRFQIICGIAKGLVYLHEDSRLRIIHRDLKASNILLDKEMNPKISDFGLARIFGGDQIEDRTNRVIGTFGYMAPEYISDGVFSTKSDVFSFGVLMLEIISGKKTRGFHDENQGLTLIGHAWTLFKEGRPFELIDNYVISSYENLQKVLRCINISLLCVQQSHVDRPAMSSVVLMLGSHNELPQPNLPGYLMDIDLTIKDHSGTKPDSSSINGMSITVLEAR
ncbi:G-type lectin S-receptor-like serine/threonine-protein kinase At4g27290 isoform X2 [Humulus lupulus]|uniref:G-type lectin S-receptor-like serine/threonine-protein kinase At4g27290 isoform X2 n=1 Tax=Humulus lupulus TaxID=3486 RepID=UPI002B40BE53|nr:G-type lectin S-receptor-like serine/threonine-protein kinase At4g27290 isoform X2 [Humulus lupulus]